MIERWTLFWVLVAAQNVIVAIDSRMLAAGAGHPTAALPKRC